MKTLKNYQTVSIGNFSFFINTANLHFVAYHLWDGLENTENIFYSLGLVKSEFSKTVLGYYDGGPNIFCRNLKDLTKLVKALKKEYRQQNLILTRKQGIKFIAKIMLKGKWEQFCMNVGEEFTDNGVEEIDVSEIYSEWSEYLEEYLPTRELALDYNRDPIYTGDTYYTFSEAGLANHIAFKEVKGTCFLNLEEAKVALKESILFTTEDGRDIFSGDTFYYNHKGYIKSYVASKLDAKGFCHGLVFSTENAVKEYRNKRDWTPGAWYITSKQSAYLRILRKAGNHYGYFINNENDLEEHKRFTKLIQNIGEL